MLKEFPVSPDVVVGFDVDACLLRIMHTHTQCLYVDFVCVYVDTATVNPVMRGDKLAPRAWDVARPGPKLSSHTFHAATRQKLDQFVIRTTRCF